MNSFWEGFEKRAANTDEGARRKKIIYSGLGAAAALGAGIAGRKVYTKYFKTFKDAVPKMDMWFTQSKFHSGPKSDQSHWYDAMKGEKHVPNTGSWRNGNYKAHPHTTETLDIMWAAGGKKNPHIKPFRHKGKWVTSEYSHYPHDPLLSDEANRLSPFNRVTVWDKKPHPDVIKQTREAGFQQHTKHIKDEGQAMKEFTPRPTGAGT